MNIGFDASRSFINKKTGTENYSFQLLQNLLIQDQISKYYIYLSANISEKEARLNLGGVAARRGLARRPQRSCYERGRTRDTELTGPRANYINIPFPHLWTQLGLASRTFLDPIDLLFVPSHTLPLIRNPGLKTVVTVHDLGAEYLPQTHQLKQRLYLNFMTHHQLKSATHLIAVSQATKNDLIKKVGIDPKKITVIYEGYNDKLYKPVQGNLLKETLATYSLIPDTYYLFVGTIQPRKNLERLIRAYAVWLREQSKSELVKVYDAVPRAAARRGANPKRASLNSASGTLQPDERATKLVLAGSRGWLSDEIYQLPKKLGIDDKVKFLGYVPDKDLPTLYSGARAFLFPSLFEGFGLPVLEAMACGCPVLTSNTSSLPEVAGDAAILINPYSVQSITGGITQLATSEVAPQLIKKGFEQVKKFSWAKAAQQTLQVFLETVAKSD